jgi:hypothetical protein
MAKKLYYKDSLGKKDGRPTIFLTKNRAGLSTIVITVILIALSLAAVVIVWVSVNNMIKKQIRGSEACFGNYDKVRLNEQYTCYERISSTNYSLRFSLSIGDIKVDKIIVSVSSASAVRGYEIANLSQNISGLSMYPSGISEINLPNMNAGLSYKAKEFTSEIDGIQIAPVISGTQCETSDSITTIENCALMT